MIFCVHICKTFAGLESGDNSVKFLQHCTFLKMAHSQPLFPYFRIFYLNLQWVGRWWDSNRRSLVLEAVALPTEPPPLPHKTVLKRIVKIVETISNPEQPAIGENLLENLIRTQISALILSPIIGAASNWSQSD